MTTCYVCKKDEDCRPYGKNAQFICFGCMMADSERQREAEQQFLSQLDACGNAAFVDGENGPVPLPGQPPTNPLQ